MLAYTSNGIVKQENFATKGYLSAVSNTMHLGIGQDTLIDSINLIWPNGKFQTLRSVKSNQDLVINVDFAKGNFYTNPQSRVKYFLVNAPERLNFVHKDPTSIEFNRDPLIPFANTNEGPSISVCDVNKDSKDDFFIGGGKGQASALFLQDSLGKFF